MSRHSREPTYQVWHMSRDERGYDTGWEPAGAPETENEAVQTVREFRNFGIPAKALPVGENPWENCT